MYNQTYLFLDNYFHLYFYKTPHTVGEKPTEVWKKKTRGFDLDHLLQHDGIHIFSHNIIMFCCLMCVFMHLSGFEYFAPLER